VTTRAPDRWLPPVLLLLFVGILLVVYGPMLSGGLLWDDEAHLTGPALRGLGGLGRIWFDLGATQQYYPLLHSFFWLQHLLWGDATTGYHLVSVLLHALNAWLAGAVLLRLGVGRVPAAVAVLAWAVHPVMVESVAWISEHKNLLSAAFYLLALLAALDFDATRRPRTWAVGTALFVLALLAKTVTATLPAVLLVLYWWRDGRIDWRRHVQPLVPWFALGVAAGLFTAWVEHELIGAKGADYELSLLERGLVAGRVVWFYLSKLALPVGLNFIYPRWTIAAGEAVQWLFPVGALALFGAAWWWRGRSRTPLAALLIFAGTLVPVLGFLNVYPFQYSFVADHFQYVASLAIVLPAVAAVVGSRRAGLGVVVLGIVILGVLSWRQARLYRNAETLFASVIARDPGSWMAHVNLGYLRHAAGDRAGAMAHFDTAARLKPSYVAPHINLGNLYFESGRIEESLASFQRALVLAPDDAVANQGAAAVYGQLQRWAEAEAHYRRALASSEASVIEADARFGLGIALIHLGRSAEAVGELEKAIARNPANADAVAQLGIALAAQGRTDEAVARYRAAIAMAPNLVDALNGLAWVLATDPDPARRNGPEAVTLAGRAVDVTGRRNPYVLDTLGAALAEAGDFAGAEAVMREAIALVPAGGNLAREYQARLDGYHGGIPAWRQLEPPR
jgi:tetratricopeptide (TPR) repeat protein